jgi:CRP-like cAMP-binding protein
MPNSTVAALSRVSLFSGLDDRELATVAEVAQERNVPRGQVLMRQGAPGDEFFLIADGEVEIRQNGQEIRRLGPGDYRGEIALGLGGKPTATAVAAKPSRLYVLAAEAFAAMLKEQPRIEGQIMTTVNERMRHRG